MTYRVTYQEASVQCEQIDWKAFVDDATEKAGAL